MDTMNVGILGAGNIAATMAKTLNRMQEAQLYAIASRTQAHADEFARQYGAERAYGSYEAMLADPAVDLPRPTRCTISRDSSV